MKEKARTQRLKLSPRVLSASGFTKWEKPITERIKRTLLPAVIELNLEDLKFDVNWLYV
jgi:hypothetical protein